MGAELRDVFREITHYPHIGFDSPTAWVYTCDMEKQIEKPKRLPENIIKAFSKVVIKECKICGAWLGDKEYKEGEGVCFKHWDN